MQLSKNKKFAKLKGDHRSLEKRIGYATATLERNIGFINTCDTKTSIILAAIGVLITMIFTSGVLTKILRIVSEALTERSSCNTLYLALLVFAMIISLQGMKNLILVLIGRIRISSNNERGLKNNSRIFFSGIMKYDKNEYKKEFRKITDEEYLDELVNEIYINAQIASIKYKKYNMGVKCIVCGFLLFVTLLLVGMYVY